jgi:N-acetylglucosaminyldiphosphoundecaprenol N-acetyl-beta-D-mannosaminyltransferase
MCASIKVSKSRQLDIALSTAGLCLLVLPMALACVIGKIKRTPQVGRNKTLFNRLTFELPKNALGALFGVIGAKNWPVLVNIFRGDMSWIGPCTSAKENAFTNAYLVRPGIANPWTIRQRTANDFASEQRVIEDYLKSRSIKQTLGILVRAAMTAMFPPSPTVVLPRVRICDVEFDNLSMKQAIQRLDQMLDQNQTHQVSFVNPACINIASGIRNYRSILARSAMVLPDGIGTKIAADLLGTPLRQNVNGTDLFPKLCDLLQKRNGSLFLLGGQEGIADKVAEVINTRWPNIKIVGVRDGFFSTAQESEVAEQVRTSGADVLLVARGVPMQDIFIDRYINFLGVKIAMGVGGLFDFVSGRINRAPDWMREMGLEWVYRFIQEPRRMWSRYLVGNFTFLTRVIAQRMGVRRSGQAISLDVGSGPSPEATDSESPRVLLFASSPAHRSIPVSDDFPAALLPFGSSTIIEQLLTQLSAASIKDIDLVVSLNPEGLREVLGNGERWGVKINWHLAKDPLRPYDAIRAQYTGRAANLLVGHADCWLSSEAIKGLVNDQSMAMQVDAQDRLSWLGWGSIGPSDLSALSPHATKGDLEALMSSTHPYRTIIAGKTVRLSTHLKACLRPRS